MQAIVRGNRIHLIPPPTVVDPTWTAEDHARFLTLQARHSGFPADIVQCLVWKRKVPGLLYGAEMEVKLADLQK